MHKIVVTFSIVEWRLKQAGAIVLSSKPTLSTDIVMKTF